MPSRNILNSTDELDSSMYPSFEVAEREEAVPQTAATLNPSSGQTAMDREQSAMQHWNVLIALRRARSNSYRAGAGLPVTPHFHRPTPYATSSQMANRQRSSTLTTPHSTTAMPSMAVSPTSGTYGRGRSQPGSSVSIRTGNYYTPSVFMASQAVDSMSQTVTSSKPSRSLSFITSAAPSATSDTLGRMPDPLHHARPRLNSIASASSAKTNVNRGSEVSRIMAQRRKAFREIQSISGGTSRSESSLPINTTPAPLTEAEKKNNWEIAQFYIKNWEVTTADQNVPLNMEWNPAQQGHKLIDLDLPKPMLLDCVFDRRLLETEDITNVEIQPDADPLVELYRILCRVEFTSQAYVYWKNLRSNDDAALRKHLDLLADLKKVETITPFAPIARYLDAWTEWRTCCDLAGSTGQDEAGKHVRPKLDKIPRIWLTRCGAIELQDLAEEKLSDMLHEKGLRGTWGREINKRLAAIEQHVATICEARDGSPFLMDVESLEILKAAHSE